MRINHIGYLVRDFNKAVKKFKALGYQESSGITHDTVRLVDICFMRMGQYVIELVSPYDHRSPASGLMKKYKNMPYHICYETDHFKEELKRLESNGFARIDEPCPAPAFEGRRVCFLMGAGAGIREILEGESEGICQ